MDIVNPEFVPDAGMDRGEMESLQEQIAERAVFTDQIDWHPEDALTVAGVDQGFTDEQAVSAVVVMEDGEIVEQQHAVVDLELPYIPGLLAFREGSSIIAALQQLEREPDIFLFDGSGRIHFREAGIATHIGVLFDIPSIGVAKSLLCGEPETPLDRPLEDGDRIPIRANDRVETVENGTVIGYAYQSKQYPNPEKRHINPLYISPGHRVSAATAVDIVARHCERYKLPEPIRQADHIVGQKDML